MHAGKALIDPHLVFDKIKLAAGMRVADLGCGRTGHFVFAASRIVGDAGIVYAVDIVKEILVSIKSRIRSEGYDNVQTVWSNIELPGKTPIPAASLDVCFIINVLFLTRDRAAAIAEAARMIKSGGVLAVIDWVEPLGMLGPAPSERIDRGALIALAERGGLIFAGECAPGDHHFCLIFKKP